MPKIKTVTLEEIIRELLPAVGKTMEDLIAVFDGKNSYFNPVDQTGHKVFYVLYTDSTFGTLEIEHEGVESDEQALRPVNATLH